MNGDLTSHPFTKRADERRYNGEDLWARERQEIKAFNPKFWKIFTQTTSEDYILKQLFVPFSSRVALIAVNIYKLDIFVNETTDSSQFVADERELYLIRECRRKGWMERYYMNLNSSELHLLCTIEMSHCALYSTGQSSLKSPAHIQTQTHK